MYREFRLRNVGALATSTTMLIASTFTLFSGSLFQALAASSKELVTLRANQSFWLYTSDSSSYDLEAGNIASLILGNNLSYPRFTHGNLAFPELLPGTAITSNSTLGFSSISIEATIPAIRGKVDCRLYNSSQHRLYFDSNFTTEDDAGKSKVINALEISVEGEDCGSKCESSSFNSYVKIIPGTSYIGQAQEKASQK